MKIADVKPLFLAVLTIFAVISSTAETKVKVYVTGDSISKEFKTIFASRLMAAVSEVPGYTVMELNESFIDPMVDEHNRRTSDRCTGNSNGNSANEDEWKFAANYMIMVELTNLFGETYATSHLTDVNAAKVIKAYDTAGKVENLSQLTALADKITDNLILAPYREEQQKKGYDILRTRAISNLTPAGCYWFDDHIVQKDPITVRFRRPVPTDNGLSISNNLPTGFKIADESFLKKLFYSGNLPDGTYYTNLIAFGGLSTNLTYAGGNKKTIKNGTWTAACLKINNFGKICEDQPWSVYSIKDNVISSVTITNFKVYAILIKAAPTETEIEQEINRLKSARY